MINLLSGSNLIGGIINPVGSAADLHVAPGATITVSVDAGGVSGIVDIAGTAYLTGGTVLVDVASGVDVEGQTYTVLLADSGVCGLFTRAQTSSPQWVAFLNHLPDSVTVTLRAPEGVPFLPVPGRLLLILALAQASVFILVRHSRRRSLHGGES